MQGEPLSKYTKDYKIFMDASALLSKEADKFWINAIPALIKADVKIIIASKVCAELTKISLSKTQPKALKDHAGQVLISIKSFKDSGFVDIFGDPDDLNTDENIFVSVFPQLVTKYNLLLISQDDKVTQQVLSLNNKKKKGANDILVQKINPAGYLGGAIVTFDSKRKAVPLNEKFSIRNVVTKIDNTLTINDLPDEGDTVTAKSGTETSKIVLVKELSKGGEGVVYDTNIEDMVAKIYFPNKVSSMTYEKLKLLCSKPILHDGICFPSSLLYNDAGEFVGFLMPKAQGMELATSVLIPSALKKKFPKWKRADLVQLCLTILEKINYMHDRNILLGDINPRNILVVSPQKVFFVDTDSYQVEGFPCPVCNTEYVCPELQNKNFSDLLRTLSSERFAIATLLFKIMMLGRHPYSAAGGYNPTENIRKANFPYNPTSDEQGDIPEGPWLYLWSHMSQDIKQAFFDSFNKQGKHYAEHMRLSSYDWHDRFEAYLNVLSNGKMKAQDTMSLSICPNRCKKAQNI